MTIVFGCLFVVLFKSQEVVILMHVFILLYHEKLRRACLHVFLAFCVHHIMYCSLVIFVVSVEREDNRNSGSLVAWAALDSFQCHRYKILITEKS